MFGKRDPQKEFARLVSAALDLFRAVGPTLPASEREVIRAALAEGGRVFLTLSTTGQDAGAAFQVYPKDGTDPCWSFTMLGDFPKR